VTSDNPDFRQIVGKDAATILDSRNMSEGEYKNSLIYYAERIILV
jgi:hypothetical protein